MTFVQGQLIAQSGAEDQPKTVSLVIHNIHYLRLKCGIPWGCRLYGMSFVVVSVSQIGVTPQELLKVFAFLGGHVILHGFLGEHQLVVKLFHGMTSSLDFEFCSLLRTGFSLTGDYE